MWGGRAEQPDELEEVNEGGSEQLAAMTSNGKSGTGYTGVDDGPVWHQAASAVWHPAAGAPSAAAPAPSPSTFNPSLYPPGYKHAFDDDYPRGPPGTPADPNPSEAAAAGGGAAAAASVWVAATPPMGSGGLADKEQLLPPGSGMRGPPPEMSGGAKSAASNKLDQDIAVALGKLDSSLHKQKSGGAQSASKRLDQVRTVTLNPYILNPEPGTLDPGPLCLNHGRRTLILKSENSTRTFPMPSGGFRPRPRGLPRRLGRAKSTASRARFCKLVCAGTSVRAR